MLEKTLKHLVCGQTCNRFSDKPSGLVCYQGASDGACIALGRACVWNYFEGHFKDSPEKVPHCGTPEQNNARYGVCKHH